MNFSHSMMILALCLCLGGCYGHPKSVRPVDNFSVTKYMGSWYEIARLDHSFERGLSHVSANYHIKENTIKIANKGYSGEQNKWHLATGEATFAQAQDQGHLHVSFFEPFSSSYVIFEVGPNYEYAFVCGPNTDYLWLLSRKNTGNEKLIERFRAKVEQKGFDPAQLIIVNHK